MFKLGPIEYLSILKKNIYAWAIMVASHFKEKNGHPWLTFSPLKEIT